MWKELRRRIREASIARANFFLRSICVAAGLVSVIGVFSYITWAGLSVINFRHGVRDVYGLPVTPIWEVEWGYHLNVGFLLIIVGLAIAGALYLFWAARYDAQQH